MTENNQTNSSRDLIELDDELFEERLEETEETGQVEPESEEPAAEMTLFTDDESKELELLFTQQGIKVADEESDVDSHVETFVEFYYKTIIEQHDAELIRIEWLDMISASTARQSSFLQELCHLSGIAKNPINGVKVYNALLEKLVEAKVLQDEEIILLWAASDHNEYVTKRCEILIDNIVKNKTAILQSIYDGGSPHKFILDTKDDETSPMAVYDVLADLCEEARIAFNIVDGIALYNAVVDGYMAIGVPDVTVECYLDKHHDARLLSATAIEWEIMGNILNYLTFNQEKMLQELILLEEKLDDESEDQKPIKQAELEAKIKERGFTYLDYSMTAEENIERIFKLMKTSWDNMLEKLEAEGKPKPVKYGLDTFMTYSAFSVVIRENNSATQWSGLYRLTEEEGAMLQQFSEALQSFFTLHFDIRVDKRLKEDFNYRREQKSELGKLKERRMKKRRDKEEAATPLPDVSFINEVAAAVSEGIAAKREKS